MMVRFVGSNMWRFLFTGAAHIDALSDTRPPSVSAKVIFIFNDEVNKAVAGSREHGASHASIS